MKIIAKFRCFWSDLCLCWSWLSPAKSRNAMLSCRRLFCLRCGQILNKCENLHILQISHEAPSLEEDWPELHSLRQLKLLRFDCDCHNDCFTHGAYFANNYFRQCDMSKNELCDISQLIQYLRSKIFEHAPKYMALAVEGRVNRFECNHIKTLACNHAFPSQTIVQLEVNWRSEEPPTVQNSWKRKLSKYLVSCFCDAKLLITLNLRPKFVTNRHDHEIDMLKLGNAHRLPMSLRDGFVCVFNQTHFFFGICFRSLM